MIKQVTQPTGQNIVADIIQKEDLLTESTGFFLIDSSNYIHCLSAYLCNILDIENYNSFLSGEILKRLILPGDVVYINFQFLSILKDLKSRVKVELRFQTYNGLRTLVIGNIRPISESLLFVKMEIKKNLFEDSVL